MTRKVILIIFHFFATFRFEASGFALPEPAHAELHLSNGDRCSESPSDLRARGIAKSLRCLVSVPWAHSRRNAAANDASHTEPLRSRRQPSTILESFCI